MGDLATTVACLIAASIFFVAAISKGVSIETFAESTRGLGAPILSGYWSRWIVPAVEAVVGILLLLGVAIVPTSLLALLLLANFTLVLVVNLRRGNRVACACFGTASNTPISYRDVLRNIFIASVLVLVIVLRVRDYEYRLGSLSETMDGIDGLEILAMALSTLALAACALVYSRLGLVLNRIEALQGGVGVQTSELPQAAPGMRIPDHVWMSASNVPERASETRQVHSLRWLIFASAECSSCHSLLDRIRSLDPQSMTSVGLVLIGFDSIGHQTIDTEIPSLVVRMEADDVADLYKVYKFPCMLEVDEIGMLLREPTHGFDAISTFLQNRHTLTSL